MRETGRYAGSVALASLVVLCIVVGAVGFVALLAEFEQSWTAYHIMERTVEQSTPVAVALAAVALATSFAAVYRAG
ncbi:hypothetical protein [Halobellus rubicundus]|uniref:Uncharacterized protein n=1 Tax=Halobellus rubicundus TaxID=2996466 RepID=A0ABD5MFB5_9EURY